MSERQLAPSRTYRVQPGTTYVGADPGEVEVTVVVPKGKDSYSTEFAAEQRVLERVFHIKPEGAHTAAPEPGEDRTHKVEIFKAEGEDAGDKPWSWRRVTAEGEVIAQVDGFETKAKAEAAAKGSNPGAEVED